MADKISDLTQSQALSGSECFEINQTIAGSLVSRAPSAGRVRKYVHKDYAKLYDEKAYNVAGGTFTQDAWRTRTLNTEYDPEGIVTLSSNQFTLQPGTYRINAEVPAFQVATHFSRLYNITDSSLEIQGTSLYSNPGGTYGGNSSFIRGEFTITSTKTFEIQHYCKSTEATNGFGNPTNTAGINSIYTVVEIWKVN